MRFRLELITWWRKSFLQLISCKTFIYLRWHHMRVQMIDPNSFVTWTKYMAVTIKLYYAKAHFLLYLCPLSVLSTSETPLKCVECTIYIFFRFNVYTLQIFRRKFIINPLLEGVLYLYVVLLLHCFCFWLYWLRFLFWYVFFVSVWISKASCKFLSKIHSKTIISYYCNVNKIYLYATQRVENWV